MHVSSSGNLSLSPYAPRYTMQQLEQMGETPVIGPDGRAGMSSSVTFSNLGAAANALTASDMQLISKVTGAQFVTTREGIGMAVAYDGLPISAQDLNAALATVQASNTNRDSTPSGLQVMAKSQAEFTDAQNFLDALVSIRQSVGPNQAITPSMIQAMVKQASTNNVPFPQEYVARAIGFLNGIG